MGHLAIVFQTIGIIHSPFTSLEGMPIQPTSQASAPGVVEVFPEYEAGLKDLDGFSHIYLIYHLHQAAGPRLQVTPFLDDQPRGVFATRAPLRPNPIGLSLVRLKRIEGAQLSVDRLDILDGTPLLDIKPYMPEFEGVEEVRIGWLEGKSGRVVSSNSDDRFK